ncbi:hypothetical protein QU814_16945 [Providencia rettgeri]|uniref:hypothetical protein n=1 Tax=Providencia rettgeri TaxID=587 RepID=UPI0022324A0F|nr:hypothetical protein [Providencia rettgeri]MDM9284823.1 hypothetical protein [Providencia rettgeri]
MSDKKEIATLSIKISVDSTDLDKLEAQLKRIKGLMVSVGLKEQTSIGFSADKFFITGGQVFIDAPLITSGTIKSAKIQGPAIDDVMRQAAKKGAEGGFLTATTKTETEDQRRIKVLEAKLSSFESSILSVQQTIADSDRAFAASLERVHADIQSAKSGW